jgi:hypothetical protein
MWKTRKTGGLRRRQAYRVPGDGQGRRPRQVTEASTPKQVQPRASTEGPAREPQRQ